MRPLRKKLAPSLTGLLAAALVMTGAPVLPVAHANTYTVPNLLITEITPDTRTADGVSGQPDAFEFVELYNNTNSTINLKNYRIVYETPTVYNWTITTDKYIAPKSTFVVWIKSQSSATLADFNANYGTSLTSSKVFEVSAAGMANTDSRVLSIANSAGTKISTAAYDADNVFENIGIPYLFPTDGSNEMRKLSTDRSPASPGSVWTGQVPPSAWENVDPATPTGFTATPGANQVKLSWNANTDSDLAFYRVYINGAHWHTYRKETTSVVVPDLVTEQDYTFEVAAVDTSNNASPKRALVSAPLSINVTQSSVSTPPEGSFPEYSNFFSRATTGAIIPGLAQNLVPQGIAYDAAKNWFLVSHYRDGGSSMLTAIDASTNKMVKSMTIYNENGTPYTGHAGGVTVTETDAWISSGDYLRRIPLQDIYNVKHRDRVYIADKFLTPTNASFNMYANGILWVGEFYASPNYLTDTAHHETNRSGSLHHSWLVGYQLDSTTGVLPKGKIVNASTPVTPDYILSIPDKIQGAAVLPDQRFALSQSYGRDNDSTLRFYENVLADTPHYYSTVNGTSVPTWYLDPTSQDTTLVAPSMTEGIAVRDGSLYTLFESAAFEYRTTGKYPLDNIMKVDLIGL